MGVLEELTHPKVQYSLINLVKIFFRNIQCIFCQLIFSHCIFLERKTMTREHNQASLQCKSLLPRLQLFREKNSFYFSMAIWNTMMGTSLLAVPWAIGSSGFATGISIIFFMTCIAYYTAYIIIDLYGKHNSKPFSKYINFL